MFYSTRKRGHRGSRSSPPLTPHLEEGLVGREPQMAEGSNAAPQLGRGRGRLSGSLLVARRTNARGKRSDTLKERAKVCVGKPCGSPPSQRVEKRDPPRSLPLSNASTPSFPNRTSARRRASLGLGPLSADARSAASEGGRPPAPPTPPGRAREALGKARTEERAAAPGGRAGYPGGAIESESEVERREAAFGSRAEREGGE